MKIDQVRGEGETWASAVLCRYLEEWEKKGQLRRRDRDLEETERRIAKL